MSVFVEILKPGTKAPVEEVVEDEFAKLIFTRKNTDFDARVGDGTTLEGQPLKNAKVIGVTEGVDDTVDITLKNKGITNSEFGVDGGGALDLEVDIKGEDPTTDAGHSVFAKNTVSGSDVDDSIKFTRARFFGNTVNVGTGEDSVTFGTSNKVTLLGENILDLGDDSDADIVKFNTVDGNIADSIAPTAAKFTIKNFGQDDIFRIKNLDTQQNIDFTQEDLKNGASPNDYFEFEFLD